MTALSMDLSRGFLPPQDPLLKLPAAFKAWEDMAAELPKLLVSQHYHQALENLPAFPHEELKTPEEVERAMLILSFLGHAYFLGGAQVKDKIPAILAKPWAALAAQLKRPPILSYASYALHNWRRIDSKGPVALGNIVLLQNFLGGIDEEWFVIVHVDIEAKAAPALQALSEAQAAAKTGDDAALEKHLTTITNALEAICDTLDRMPERCDPYIYYNRVRPYIHGSKNNPALPEGVIYEGCFDNKAQYFRGETGAQSTIIPSLDAVFGIVHEKDELRVYLQEMRDYMPEEHRDFLNQLEKNGSVRERVQAQAKALPELARLYNRGIELIVRFRMTHLKYAATYIQKQSQHSAENSNTVGTGGTPFMTYLLKHEQESERFKV